MEAQERTGPGSCCPEAAASQLFSGELTAGDCFAIILQLLALRTLPDAVANEVLSS